MAYDDDDKPKLSWRELDKKREQSTHRKPDVGAGRPDHRARSNEYRAYKSQLNKLFDGGAVPDALKNKLEDAGVDNTKAKDRKAKAQEIIEATAPKDILAKLKAYREEFGFPEDEQVLGKLLELEDEELALVPRFSDFDR